jgi:hypothetical protein
LLELTHVTRIDTAEVSARTLAVGMYSQKIGFKSQDLVATSALVGCGIIPRGRCFPTMCRYLWLGLAAVSLSGCAGSPVAIQREAQAQYAKSVANYRTCLIENSSNVKACEGLRLVMETDERAFNNMSASLPPNFSGTRSVNIQEQQR